MSKPIKLYAVTYWIDDAKLTRGFKRRRTARAFKNAMAIHMEENDNEVEGYPLLMDMMVKPTKESFIKLINHLCYSGIATPEDEYTAMDYE